MTKHITNSEAQRIASFDGISFGFAGGGEGAVVTADICMLYVIEGTVADHRAKGTDIFVGFGGFAVDDEAFEVVVS